MPATLQELEDQAERVFMDLNNNHAAMLRKAMYSIKRRARACVRNRGRSGASSQFCSAIFYVTNILVLLLKYFFLYFVCLKRCGLSHVAC